MAIESCSIELQQAISLNQEKEDKRLFAEKVNYLAIAYYNVGVEYEFLSKPEKAVESYQ